MKSIRCMRCRHLWFAICATPLWVLAGLSQTQYGRAAWSFPWVTPTWSVSLVLLFLMSIAACRRHPLLAGFGFFTCL
ncbi:MAG TPA: hypothetical protein VLD18_04905, partial [Verrucomicrobiae bacterium]|nr:hypothetical protein [Verrucomicrobiae bacterium]